MNLRSRCAAARPSVGRAALTLAAAACISAAGCCSQFAYNAVPANRLPLELQGESRSCKVPIDFSMLRQSQPDDYRLGPGDVLTLYAQDVLPPSRETFPLLQGTFAPNPVYYPANGLVDTPAIGVPLTVQNNGMLPLPMSVSLPVDGLTLSEATQAVRKALTQDKKLLVPGREQIILSLLRPRTTRVLVLRDDAQVGNDMIRTVRREETLLARRGTAAAVDLPAYENDVLHAILTTGGLPGVDAYSDVWVLHGKQEDFEPTRQLIEAGDAPSKVLSRYGSTHHIVKIPLRLLPGEPAPFGPEDVILHDGDIVYIETRQTEFFYSGGLLPGGQIPLPRDYDLDVIGAIALANGSVAGPAGLNAATVLNVRSGPGNIVPPTRVIILRTLPDGEQVKIRVDLNIAMNNPKERVRILPGDVVMLNYKPHEVVQNTMLNLVNFNLSAIFTGP